MKARKRVSGNPGRLMCLEAESPARMRETVVERCLGIGLAARTIHRLQEEMPEVHSLEPFGFGACLRKDELELVARFHHQLRIGLGAHAEPVDSVGWDDGTVR